MKIASRRQAAVAVAGLGFAVALVARDLALPLFMISMFGLFDRLVGEPFVRARGWN